MKTVLVAFVFLCSHLMNCQRVAPGVPPQQYQQPSYQQQQYQQPHQHPPQQQQFQQQQQQQHYQQPNPQFQQQTHQQVHSQQVPVQQAGDPGVYYGHSHGHQQQAHVLNTANIEHEKEHIAEHLDIPIDTKDMTTEQLQFHYFQMHDADRNNKLDGCELIKSLIHWHEQGSKGGENSIEERIFKDEELVTLIDPILSMDDSNNDGYIDYPEFIQAQRKAAAGGTPPKH